MGAGTATGYGLSGAGLRFSIPVQTDPEDRTALCTKRYRVIFPRKAAGAW